MSSKTNTTFRSQTDHLREAMTHGSQPRPPPNKVKVDI